MPAQASPSSFIADRRTGQSTPGASRLILNADDFGLTRGINRAIEELHRARAITSATLMATGTAFDDAVSIAQANPTLGVGCHIVLTDGTPAADPAQIPTLLGPDGRTFRPSFLHFARALVRHQISEAEMLLEASAQIETLQRAGVQPTHLDSHKHTHVFASVLRPLLQAAQRTGVGAIRNPFEPPWAMALRHGSIPRRLAVRVLRRAFYARFEGMADAAQIATTDGTLAISTTGDLTGDTLREILDALPGTGTYELVVHPGYVDADLSRINTRLRDTREVERAALLAEVPRLSLNPNAPRLIHYADLTREGPA